MKSRLLHYTPMSINLAILLFRIFFGGMFMYFGYPKLANFEEMLAMFGDPIGIGSKLSLILVIFAELVCGFLVLIGLFTRLATIPIFITMCVAYFVAHAADPFQAKISAFTFLVLTPIVFLLGSGRYSVDRALTKG